MLITASNGTSFLYSTLRCERRLEKITDDAVQREAAAIRNQSDKSVPSDVAAEAALDVCETAVLEAEVLAAVCETAVSESVCETVRKAAAAVTSEAGIVKVTEAVDLLPDVYTVPSEMVQPVNSCPSGTDAVNVTELPAA